MRIEFLKQQLIIRDATDEEQREDC